MFSVGDIYKRLKPFKAKILSHPRKLYFAKVDVQSAFDTIPQAAIVGLLESIPQARQYRLSKYLEVAPSLVTQSHGKATGKPKLTRRWPLAATRSRDTPSFFGLLESGGRATNRRNTVFVDSFGSKRDYETSELLRLVASHIQQNLVKIGKKFYRQGRGIPQGSVLSSTLCNYFYADLEAHVLTPFLDPKIAGKDRKEGVHGEGRGESDGDYLLLRLIDDFLLITTDVSKATRFVETMHRGVPEYGVAVNPHKTLVNFELRVNGQPVPRISPGEGFPYCGTKIDCETLDITRARDKERKDSSKYYLHNYGRGAYWEAAQLMTSSPGIYNSLTVEYTRTPGQSFQRKVLSKFLSSGGCFYDITITLLQHIDG